jgi:hypothetical protein
MADLDEYSKGWDKLRPEQQDELSKRWAGEFAKLLVENAKGSASELRNEWLRSKDLGLVISDLFRHAEGAFLIQSILKKIIGTNHVTNSPREYSITDSDFSDDQMSLNLDFYQEPLLTSAAIGFGQSESKMYVYADVEGFAPEFFDCTEDELWEEVNEKLEIHESSLDIDGYDAGIEETDRRSTKEDCDEWGCNYPKETAVSLCITLDSEEGMWNLPSIDAVNDVFVKIKKIVDSHKKS